MASTPQEHPRITHFRTHLQRHQPEPRIVVLPDSVHTAQLAADALGCAVGAIANSLLFAAIPLEHTDPTPVLLLTSGAHRVDTAKVAADLGLDRLSRANPDFVKAHSGQVIGGVSPIGHPGKIPTYLDPELRHYDEIWAAAGHPAAVFATTYTELRDMTVFHELLNKTGRAVQIVVGKPVAPETLEGDASEVTSRLQEHTVFGLAADRNARFEPLAPAAPAAA